MPKYLLVLISLFVLCATSCRTLKVTSESTEKTETNRLDSVSRLEIRETKTYVTAPATAKLNLSPLQIAELPPGAGFRNKQGNASIEVKMQKDGTLELTANCDSLTLLLDNLTIELYHLNSENTAIKHQLKQEKTVEVNKPTGWQWFQIYGFRIYVLLTIIYIIYRKWKIK